MTHQSCVSDLNEIQMSFLNGKNMINQKVVLWICGFICAQFRALFAAQGLSTFTWTSRRRQAAGNSATPGRIMRFPTETDGKLVYERAQIKEASGSSREHIEQVHKEGQED